MSTAIGIPAILIPSPYVTANHQTKNAMSLVKRDAAVLLTEKQLNHQSLVHDVDKLISEPNRLSEMTMNSKRIGMPDASDRVLRVLKALTK